MPSISQTTPSVPLAGSPDTNRNGVLDRRAASRRQKDSVLKSQWPLVTKAAYDQLARGGKVPDELADLRKKRLCVGRNALGTALIALSGAMHDYRPQQKGLTPEQVDSYAKVWQELRRAHLKVEKCYLEYPLTVQD